MTRDTARLLISCPDRKGIIAAVTAFIARFSGNILEADQHSDPQSGEFFMRLEIESRGFGLDRTTFPPEWTALADEFAMRWRVFWSDIPKRMAVFVSKEGHCLSDLLWRWRTGEIPVHIPFVAGNHETLADEVRAYGIEFRHVPIGDGGKPAQEAAMLKMLSEANIDFVVLARYMQVLSPEFVSQYRERIINIHHSFLPAFAGPRPYHQAFTRGVKIIGATSHYVTDDLDQGPIIAQQTTPVGHRDTIDDLIRKGRDLERVVLATAVRLHVEDKILVSRNKTVVFD